MGRSIPVSPESYRPKSVVLLQEKLTKEILECFDEMKGQGLSTVDISIKIRKKYPTFRIGYISDMRCGMLLGTARLLAICEALGILLAWQTVKTQRQQITLTEAA